MLLKTNFVESCFLGKIFMLLFYFSMHTQIENSVQRLIVFGKFSPGLAVLIFETQAKVIQILSFLIIRNFQGLKM